MTKAFFEGSHLNECKFDKQFKDQVERVEENENIDSDKWTKRSVTNT